MKALDALPDGAKLAIRTNVTLTRRLDYPDAELRLVVESPEEFHLRANACKKEPETIRWIRDFVRAGDVVYDIGANVGTYSLVVAQSAGGKAKCYAFEPAFGNYYDLCRNVILNGCEHSVFALPIALSDETSIQSLLCAGVLPGQAQHALGGTAGGVSQPALSFELDELLDRFGLAPPTHMKIDVDGHEVKVLRGAQRTLRTGGLKSVLIELDSSGDTARDATALLEDAGLRLHARHERPLVANCVFLRA